MNLMMRIAAAASTVALWPAAATAAGELGLSNDGSAWSSNLTSPLFDANIRWVPGDRREESFWVRNMSGDKATLDVSVLGSSVDSLMQTGDLGVEVKAGSGAWHTTNHVGRHKLVSSMKVNPGQQEKVTVAVDFDPSSPNESQLKNYDLNFEVRLTQDTSGGKDHDHGSPHHGNRDKNGDLPGTGGLQWWVLPLGTGLTGAGVALVVGARKEPSHG